MPENRQCDPDDGSGRGGIMRPGPGEHLGYARRTDPPRGSWAARLNEKVKPWAGLIVTAGTLCGAVWAVLLTLGFSLTRPSDEMTDVRARVAALEVAAAEARAQQEQSAQFLHALVRAECIALRRGDNDLAVALTVLPCDEVFQYWPTRPAPNAAAPAPAIPRVVPDARGR